MCAEREWDMGGASAGVIGVLGSCLRDVGNFTGNYRRELGLGKGDPFKVWRLRWENQDLGEGVAFWDRNLQHEVSAPFYSWPISG